MVFSLLLVALGALILIFGQNKNTKVSGDSHDVEPVKKNTIMDGNYALYDTNKFEDLTPSQNMEQASQAEQPLNGSKD